MFEILGSILQAFVISCLHLECISLPPTTLSLSLCLTCWSWQLTLCPKELGIRTMLFTTKHICSFRQLCMYVRGRSVWSLALLEMATSVCVCVCVCGWVGECVCVDVVRCVCGWVGECVCVWMW